MNQSKAQIKHRLPSAGKCLLASYIWTNQNSDQTQAAKGEKMLTSKLHLNQSKLRSNTGCQARENAYKQVTLDLNWLRRATSFLRQSWSKVMQNHGNLQITAFTNQFKPKTYVRYFYCYRGRGIIRCTRRIPEKQSHEPAGECCCWYTQHRRRFVPNNSRSFKKT